MSSEALDFVQLAVIGALVALVYLSSRQAPAPARGGCQFCGDTVESPKRSACLTCVSRERTHQQRMATLAEKESRLRADLMLEQIAELRRHAGDVPAQQGARDEQ